MAIGEFPSCHFLHPNALDFTWPGLAAQNQLCRLMQNNK